jgi:hypothetical protein
VTLLKSGSVWKKLVLDAKKRGCFYEANEDKRLAHVMTRLFFFFFYTKRKTSHGSGKTTCRSANIWHMPHNMHQIIRVTSNSGI